MISVEYIRNIAVALVLSVLSGCLSTGCDALREFGPAVAETPGVSMRGGSLWSAPEFRVTSDCRAKLEYLEYGSSDPNGPRLVIKNAEFGQEPSTTLKQMPAFLEKLPPILKTREEIAKAGFGMLASVARSVEGAVSPVAAVANAVSDMYAASRQPMPPAVAELVARVKALEDGAQDAVRNAATTQPANIGVEAAP